MTKNELFVAVAAILTTLAETDGAPASTLYLALDMNIDRYNYVRDFMLNAQWITVSGYYVKLTPSGRMMADKINKAISK